LALEVQTLRYYLVPFSLFFLIFIYFFHIEKIIEKKTIIIINKGDTIEKIVEILASDKNNFKKNIYYYSLRLFNQIYAPINYGKFIIEKNSSFLDIVKVISKKSNLDYKITIIEGWQEFELVVYLNNFYDDLKNISYFNLLADTYLINSSNSFNQFENFLFQKKNEFIKNFKDNKLLKKYGIKNIFIISSLVEKEAKNNYDKGLIASVIFNRLEKNMRLEIDASVIFSLTEGKFKFDRKLYIKDLKYNHPYNTYVIKALPPGMISYISKDTLKSVLESKKSNFLFYFYDVLEKKHIFTRNYNEHKKKLYEYRKKTK